MRILKYLFITGLVATVYLYLQLLRPVSQATEPITIEIAQGESFKQVATTLHENGLVRNQTVFRLYGRLVGLDTGIKAGRYQIEPTTTPIGLLDFLITPDHGEISVTIPEGSTVFDIDERLTKLGLIKKGEFLTTLKGSATFNSGPNSAYVNLGPVSDPNLTVKVADPASPEGYLFPDTYFVFAKGFRSQDLITKMVANFQKKVVAGLSEPLKNSKRSLHELVIMASILEKEVRTQDDLTVVSGILWKRLDNDWPLQADATLLYGKRDRELSFDEIRDDDAYNTYTRKGLPAGPIGNPGVEMIRAAAQPEESEYWFYLTDAQGAVHYAKTNDEHNKNVDTYLR